MLAQVYLRSDQLVRAFLLLEPKLLAGEVRALQVLGPRIADERLDKARVHAALEALVNKLDDAAPAYARLSLAHLCMQAGDHDCVRFQATCAAATGAEPDALQAPLHWLAEHHPDARVQADALAWWRSLNHHALEHRTH